MGQTTEENVKCTCSKCGSSFNTMFLMGKQGNADICPMCGASLLGDSDDSSHDEPLSFGEDVKLGENDSFDEEKIDFWWYKIREPKTLGADDTGDVGTTCTNCGHLSFAPYPIAESNGYLLIDSRYHDKCSGCGKELKNHILSKRPADFVDPRQKEMFVKDYMNMPKCPICSSTKIHKISMTNKAAAAITFGVLAAGHVSKTYQCDICKSKF